jgi:enamine deaminase RidA (YjgF/YER057c/UK114 family)
MKQQLLTPEENLKRLGLELAPVRKAAGNYITHTRVGNLIFLSGQGVDQYKGKLGKEIDLETGYKAAQQSVLNLLSVLKHEIGDLSKVKKVVKLLGFVNSTADFIDQPKVMNGASDLLVEIFGEKGKHARSAVGMIQLPNNTTVEIEMIIEVED